VTDVEQIEVAIGQRDAITGAAPVIHALAQFLAAQDFVWRLQFRVLSYQRSMRPRRRRRLLDGLQQLFP
jgi:hypothetical protein